LTVSRRDGGKAFGSGVAQIFNLSIFQGIGSCRGDFPDRGCPQPQRVQTCNGLDVSNVTTLSGCCG
jgi:hypothetical protein